MEGVFTQFQKLNGTTWLYLSFLLSIAVFFRFSRFFCLRNWDLLTLYLLVPGLLTTAQVDRRMLQIFEDAQNAERMGRTTGPVDFDPRLLHDLRHGYVWLFVGGAYLLLRCGIDLALTRRPRLDTNMDVGGLAFLGVSLLGFLMFEAITREPDPAGRLSATVAAQGITGARGDPAAALPSTKAHPATTAYHAAVHVAVDALMKRLQDTPSLRPSELAVGVARSAAILAHLAVIVALVLIGWQHFGSPQSGVGMAVLYLLTPLTAINVEKVDHLLPCALSIWAVYAYRRPMFAGVLLGLAGVFFFPLFLMPLWMGFYGRKSVRPFLVGFFAASAVVWGVMFASDTLRETMSLWLASFDWKAAAPGDFGHPMSFWSDATQIYRLPIFVGFMILVIGAAFWPSDKNLADLLALSAAIMIGVQFWHPNRGGTYIHWYLPFLLLMMFRPNLQNARPQAVPLAQS